MAAPVFTLSLENRKKCEMEMTNSSDSISIIRAVKTGKVFVENEVSAH